MAIPGSIHSAQARGCHALIRQGAKLVETTQDVLEELAPVLRSSPPVLAQPAEERAPCALLMAMGFDPVTPEVLAQRTALDISALQAALLNLELNGEVARLPGGFFQRLRRRG